MNEHEERLRAMSEDRGDTWDLSDNDQAACLAGAEALRLLREYQEAFKAFDAVASLLSAPPAAPAPADLVATCEWSEDANGELAENAPEFLAPQPADGVTQAQHEIVASIIDMVEHDQSRRAEMNRLRADALRAVLARALASPAPPATNEHEQAAQQILVTLAPLVSDAAIVGRTYGWPEVLAVVNAAAKKLASPAPQPAAPAPVACPNCGGMGETTHDILTGGTEHDTEQRECDVCKGTGLAAPAPAKCATGHVWSNQFGEDWTPEHGKPCDCGAKRWRGADAVEPPPADRCEQQNPRTLEQCVRLRGHSGDHVGDIDEAVTRRIWSPASPSLRGGGIISHAEIEDARKAQE